MRHAEENRQSLVQKKIETARSFQSINGRSLSKDLKVAQNLEQQ
jgi:hypothetical protein